MTDSQVRSKRRIADHGEVFTGEREVKAMCDLVKQETERIESRFLEPACGNGNFLAEVLNRKLAVVKARYGRGPADYERYAIVALSSLYGVELLEDNAQECRERLFSIWNEAYTAAVKKSADNQYGVAITELTSLLSRRSVYCSKYPNSKFSISYFDDPSGNIRFKRIQHTWQNGKCLFCGASQSEYERGSELETHAYEWIHTVKPEEIFGMKFDVIIGNPPYQLSDGGGNGKSAIPLYQKFVEQSKKLKPRYLTMIIPARWFGGGKGLDNFRAEMLSDTHIRTLVDYTDSSDCFSGVDIAGGVCYFLWDRDNAGLCKVENTHSGKTTTTVRKLDEFSTFVRYGEAVNIIQKVRNKATCFMDSQVLPRRPFGLDSNAHLHNTGEVKVKCASGYGYLPKGAITVGLTDEEINFIESMIKPMELGGDDDAG